MKLGAALLFTALMALGGGVFAQDEDVAKLEKQRCPKPAEFASVFSFGYGKDLMPTEDERFDKLLGLIKEGGFNVVHCVYSDKRLELCKEHGIKMMVDLLEDDHHIFKKPDAVKKLCEKLQKNPDVWGYNIWNDNFGKTGEGRRRDVNNVRRWDPTHPAFCGTYRTGGMKALVNPDVFGYYDFHWKRGIGMHFPHLMVYHGWARERDAWIYSWLSASSGLPGKGNFNRNLYSANTGIAFGMKGVMWFLATDLMNRDKLEWTEAGRDIIKVNKEIMPLRKELAKLGNPEAVYTTRVTKTPNNTPLDGDKQEAMPAGLEKNAFPKDFWALPVEGEVVMGVYAGEKKRNIVFVANHNAYVEQKVGLKLSREMTAEIFNRKDGRWQALETPAQTVRFMLSAGGGELLRFGD